MTEKKEGVTKHYCSDTCIDEIVREGREEQWCRQEGEKQQCGTMAIIRKFRRIWRQFQCRRLPLAMLLTLLVIGGGQAHAVERWEEVSQEEALALRNEARSMFMRTFRAYMDWAFPKDELKPLSCDGEDTLGGYSVTFIDSLDSIAIVGGNATMFAEAVRWAERNLSFDVDRTVSVFETNIRVLGGLLTAHLLATDPKTGYSVDGYSDGLLDLALDLGKRLLPAFETPTGIPYGSINLKRGVEEDENPITSTACAGTLSLEFGFLSRLSGDERFEKAALRSMRALWSRRSPLGLVGAHIHTHTGEWTQADAGVGTAIDSFYEYLLKAYVLFGEEEYLHVFERAYSAAERHLKREDWYVEVNMNSGGVVWPLFNSLQAFWPGLQVRRSASLFHPSTPFFPKCFVGTVRLMGAGSLRRYRQGSRNARRVLFRVAPIRIHSRRVQPHLRTGAARAKVVPPSPGVS